MQLLLIPSERISAKILLSRYLDFLDVRPHLAINTNINFGYIEFDNCD